MQVQRRLVCMLVGLLALLVACGSSGGTNVSGRSAAANTTPTTTSRSPALPSNPCALLSDTTVKQIMGWPSSAEVQGEPLESPSSAEGVAPSCQWRFGNDGGNPYMFSLVIYRWSEMQRRFADPQAVVKETDNDRIWTLAYGDLYPAAVVRFGEEAVLVSILDGTPDRANPVDAAVQILDAYSE